MNKPVTVLVSMITGLALLATPSVTRADHIPNHDNCDPTFPMPVPGQEFFNGGVLFVNLIGPVEDHVITNTTFDITYVSDGATPASDIQLHGFITVDGGTSNFVVTGADLGFGSGPGTFKGVYETDALNGVADASFFFPPYAFVDLQIDAITGGINGSGYFVDSFITCDVIPAPPCEPPGCGPCPTDVNSDHETGPFDLANLLAAWGECNADDPCGCLDANSDGDIGPFDLASLLAAWGPCL